LVDKLQKGDEIELDMENGTIKLLRTGDTVQFRPLPPFIMGILRDGGLIPHLKKKKKAS
jgi:3-isopropylmalate/(R)-2-methylmalate dehydratase small subunit